MKNSTFGKLTLGLFSVGAIAVSSVLMTGGAEQSPAAAETHTSTVSESSVVFESVKIPKIEREVETVKSDFAVDVEIVLPEPEPAVKVEKKSDSSSNKSSNSRNSNSKNSKSDNNNSSKSKNIDSNNSDKGKAEAKPEPKTESKPKKSKWDSCIDRVDPNRTVDWRIGSYDYYGQASTNYVLLGNHTPDHRKCAVVYHEWFHTVHARKEGGIGNIINTYGRNRMESIADCGALMLGADWVNYGCGGETDRQKAREILGW